MSLAFEDAQLSDVDAILGFMQDFYALEDIRIPFDEPVARRVVTELILDQALGRIWVIVDESEAIGYVVLTFGYSLEYHGRDALLDELYIEASHRGRGVGMAALRFLDTVCRDLGLHALHLEVSHTNAPARNLYRKAGFDVHGTDFMTRWISR